MNGRRTKQLRRRLFNEWPTLEKKYGGKLKPFNSVFRLIKKGYNAKFRRGGWELARTM